MREAGSGKREAHLIEFLESKRWFGEKGHEILDARVHDAIPIDWQNTRKPFAVSRVDVTTVSGTWTYQLFSPRAEVDVDALQDPDFLRGLADVWVKGASFGDGVRWIVETEGNTPLVVPPNAPVALSSGEQTNSSVILNREAILKLYRRLEAGVHPDVEVSRFLTIERQFVNVPVLMGTIRFEDAGGVTIAGMLQEYVQGATDGWTYVLEQLSALGSRLPAPDDKNKGPRAESRLIRDAFELGVVVRALHDTLASGDPGSAFDLHPATKSDVRRWVAGAEATIESGVAALRRACSAGSLHPDACDAADRILDQKPTLVARLNELETGFSSDAGANTRTHGDLHLGQVLRSATGQFLIIDFEGEPRRTLEERRSRSSPLRDVAGMLRSFTYAFAFSSRQRVNAESPEPLAAAWESAVRQAFLDGYFSEPHGRPGLLPNSRREADRLIALFESEKLFYELQYELAHRPDWVSIPLRDITRLLK